MINNKEKTPKVKVVLPFTSDAILSAYPFFSNFFGILQGHTYNVKGVAYNNFILLGYALLLDYLFFTAGFPEGRKIRKYFCREKMQIQPDRVIEYLKDNLNLGKYAIIVLNAKHLSNVPFDREWYHDWMLYGYDDETESFSAFGTVVNTSCHAFVSRKIQISYDELRKALPSGNKNTHYHQQYMNNCFYWLPENFTLEPVNIRKIKRNVFFFSYNILPLCFNAKTYKKYALVLRFSHQKSEKQFNLRPFKVLQEHKQLILQMMNDLVPNSAAAEEYQSIVKLANTIQVVALKYNMTKRSKQKAIDIMCDALYKLRAEEPAIMRQFYKELKVR